MTAKVFIDNDRQYIEWLDNNPSGWVINVRRNLTPSYMVLHKANCKKIRDYNKMSKPGGFTERGYAKVCGKDVEALSAWTKSYGRPNGSFSKKCGFCN